MRFNCGLTDAEKRARAKREVQRLKQWHEVFLFLPTTVEEKDGKKICYWLTKVERNYPDAWVCGWHDIVKNTPQYRVVQK